MIDKDAHRELHGNRLHRVIEICNDIARFLNVEAKAKQALSWLTQQVKRTLWETWKTLAGFANSVSAKIQRILGFGPDEEPTAGSIITLEDPPSDGTIPVF
jgi:hypothetical protein